MIPADCNARIRIIAIEMLDEVEELDLVLDHYAISWAAVLPNESPEEWLNWDLRWGA